jgi:hypothetical protein
MSTRDKEDLMSVLGDDGLGRFREEPFPEDGSPAVDVPIDVPDDLAPADPPVLVDVPDDPGGSEPPDLGWGPLFEGDSGNPSGDEGAE